MCYTNYHHGRHGRLQFTLKTVQKALGAEGDEALLSAIQWFWHRDVGDPVMAPYRMPIIKVLDEAAGTMQVMYASQQDWFAAYFMGNVLNEASAASKDGRPSSKLLTLDIICN